MGKPRVGILAAWIGGGCVVLAALVGVLGKAYQPEKLKQSMVVKDSTGTRSTQVTGNYNSQVMMNSPGAFQVSGDFNNYPPMPQSETRPYLNIELRPSFNEYLKKDGNSQLYCDSLYNNIYLILPFKIRNVGKIHALKILAKYSSPSQSDVPIQLGEKSSFLDSGDEIAETFRPHVNIATVINNDDIKEFTIKLELFYNSYDNNDHLVYNTKLELVLIKEKTSEHQMRYIIKDSKLTFGDNKTAKQR